MDKQRGMIVLGGSVALLVSAAALTLWLKNSKEKNSQKAEKLIEEYEEYVHAEPSPKKRPTRRATRTNGKVVHPA